MVKGAIASGMFRRYSKAGSNDPAFGWFSESHQHAFLGGQLVGEPIARETSNKAGPVSIRPLDGKLTKLGHEVLEGLNSVFRVHSSCLGNRGLHNSCIKKWHGAEALLF
jgi:hypothetical protein